MTKCILFINHKSIII